MQLFVKDPNKSKAITSISVKITPFYHQFFLSIIEFSNASQFLVIEIKANIRKYIIHKELMIETGNFFGNCRDNTRFI